MRITSYEWGVTYAGMLQATQNTGDQRYRNYVNTRLNGIARMAAHMRANYPNATADTYPLPVTGVSIRRVRGVMTVIRDRPKSPAGQV